MTSKPMLSSFGRRRPEAANDLFDDMDRRLKQEVDRIMASFGNTAPNLLNIRETDSGLAIEGRFPGLEEKDMEIVLSGATLTIKAERTLQETKDNSLGRYACRSVSRFAERVELPFEADPNGVTKSLHDGVLRISIPKARSFPPKPTRLPNA